MLQLQEVHKKLAVGALDQQEAQQVRVSIHQQQAVQLAADNDLAAKMGAACAARQQMHLLLLAACDLYAALLRRLAGQFQHCQRPAAHLHRRVTIHHQQHCSTAAADKKQLQHSIS
jgi:hypothetical protein